MRECMLRNFGQSDLFSYFLVFAPNLVKNGRQALLQRGFTCSTIKLFLVYLDAYADACPGNQCRRLRPSRTGDTRGSVGTYLL
jgi:hypothetical protein